VCDILSGVEDMAWVVFGCEWDGRGCLARRESAEVVM
jgi:hypothetical protein